MSWSAWAAITEYHRLGGLNSKNVGFFTVLEAEVPGQGVAGLVSGEDILPGLQMAILSSYGFSSKPTGRESFLVFFS